MYEQLLGVLNKNLRKVKWILRILSNKLQLTLYNNIVANSKRDVMLVGDRVIHSLRMLMILHH
jgi:hypothetical protein